MPVEINEDQLKEIAYFVNYNFNQDKQNSLTNMAIQVKILAQLFGDKKKEKEIDYLTENGYAKVDISVLELIYFKFMQNTQTAKFQKIRIGKKRYSRYDLGLLIRKTKSDLYSIYHKLMKDNNVHVPFDWGTGAIKTLKEGL